MKKKDPAKNSFLNNTVNILILIAFGYFLFRLFYFAVNISPYVPPDEVTHFGKCMIFSKALLLPKNSEASYSLGLVTHIPYLYYFIMGKLVALNFSHASDLVFLRLFNCILSFLTVFFGYKWIKLVTDNRMCQLLFIVLLTNTLMFTFLGASVTYDNMVNMLAVVVLYYLFLFFKSRNPIHFLIAGIFLLSGTLTKLTFLPLAVAYVVIFVFHERSFLKQPFILFAVVKQSVLSFSLIQKLMALILGLFLAMNMVLYLGNLIQFKKLSPSPFQILTEEQCMQERLAARTHIVQLYKQGKITAQEAMKMVSRIQHEGDQRGTLALLQAVENEKQGNRYRVDRFHYAFVWIDRVLAKTYGIMAHKSMEKSGASLVPYYVVFFLSAFLLIRKQKRSDFNGYGAYIVFVFLFYVLILMQLVNYRTYFSFGLIDFALQGRYIFPVMVPFYCLVSVAIACYLPKSWQQWIASGLTSVIFIYGDFPWFLKHVANDWFF
jgi:hypothetical protein